MKQIALLLCATTLAACSDSPNTMSVTTKPVTIEPRETFEAKNIVASKTDLPDAARFQGFVAYSLSNGDRVYCGEMQAVNANGAGADFLPFYVRRSSGGAVKSLHYTEKSSKFATQKCAEAKSGRLKIAPN